MTFEHTLSSASAINWSQIGSKNLFHQILQILSDPILFTLMARGHILCVYNQVLHGLHQLSQLKSGYIYHSCLARRSLVCIPHSKGLSVYSESTRSPANENGPIYLRSQKTKQSKRMNAISLDNSLHFSGSPFAFLGIFSLGRGTPNSQLYSSAIVWSPN